MKSKIKLFCISVLLMGFSHQAFAENIYGVFKVVKGKVEVVSKGGKRQPAKLGGKVFPEDKIVTSKDSRAKVVMVDNNELNVTPESEIEIAKYDYKPEEGKKNVLVNVLYGKIRAKVNQKYEGENKFQIKTPSAVAGVRGTDFFTSYAPKTRATKIVTFEGRVEFGLPGPNGAIRNPVMVGVGQTASSLAGRVPTRPMRLPKSELTAFDNGSNAGAGADLPDDGSSGRDPASERKDDKGEKKKDEGRSEKRGPASPGGMLRESDTISSSTGPVAIVESGPRPPPPPPIIRELPPIPRTCTYCQTVIQDGTRSLILNVQHQNPTGP